MLAFIETFINSDGRKEMKLISVVPSKIFFYPIENKIS